MMYVDVRGVTPILVIGCYGIALPGARRDITVTEAFCMAFPDEEDIEEDRDFDYYRSIQ